ncbi:hypothetical protein [Inquilinus sp.]|uniref:hypothetical protein n=1 Tax=Inquilinus sp. TaxID=1932117 RepID=UPI0031DD7369
MATDSEMEIEPIVLPAAEWIGMASSDAGTIGITFKISMGDPAEPRVYALPISAAQAQEFLFILWKHGQEKGWAIAQPTDPTTRQ